GGVLAVDHLHPPDVRRQRHRQQRGAGLEVRPRRAEQQVQQVLGLPAGEDGTGEILDPGAVAAGGWGVRRVGGGHRWSSSRRIEVPVGIASMRWVTTTTVLLAGTSEVSCGSSSA